MIYFLWEAGGVACPVMEFPGRSMSQTQFVQFFVWYIKVVLEEGTFPLPLCPRYDIFPPWEALSRLYPTMVICTKVSEHKYR